MITVVTIVTLYHIIEPYCNTFAIQNLRTFDEDTAPICYAHYHFLLGDLAGTVITNVYLVANLKWRHFYNVSYIYKIYTHYNHLPCQYSKSNTNVICTVRVLFKNDTCD